MVSFSTITSGAAALLLTNSYVLSQDVQPCVADEIEAVVGVMNLVAKAEFDSCSAAVGFDFNVNLPGYLEALAGDCSAAACKDAFALVLPNADVVPTCTIDGADGEQIQFVDAIVKASDACADATGTDEPVVTTVAPTLPACTGDDVQFIVDAMNDVAEDEFNTCVAAVGVDFNTDLVPFLVEVYGNCGVDPSCALAIEQVVGIADQVPSCSIDNPLNPGTSVPVVEVVGAVAGKCSDANGSGSGSGPALPACTGDDVQFIVDAMNAVAEDEFNTCVAAVGVDFNTDLVPFLVEVYGNCSVDPSCALAIEQVVGIADQVPSCSIDNPLNPGTSVPVVEVVGAVAGKCSGDSGSGSGSVAPLPACGGEDVQTIVDAMNAVAEDEFNACIAAVGVDFNTNLVDFLVAVNSDCSNPDCATAIGEVVNVADQVPSCSIDNPLSPGTDIAVVDVVGVVAGSCGVGGGSSGSGSGSGTSDGSGSGTSGGADAINDGDDNDNAGGSSGASAIVASIFSVLFTFVLSIVLA